MLSRITIPSLFVIAAAALLLVYTGIHNAWDAVVYVTLYQEQRRDDESKDTQ